MYNIFQHLTEWKNKSTLKLLFFSDINHNVCGKFGSHNKLSLETLKLF